MLEKQVQKKILVYLKAIGACARKIPQNMYGAGTADILACYKGRALAIEVKRSSGGVVSKIQEQFLNEWAAAGGIAFVACSVDDVIEGLKGV